MSLFLSAMSPSVAATAALNPTPSATPCPPGGWAAAAINAASAHWYGIPALILAGVFGIILFALIKGIGGENVSKLWGNKADKALTDERDEAKKNEAAARDLSATLLGQVELMQMVLTTASVSIQQLNDWPAGADHDQYRDDAMVYLCDWTTRIFAFSKSDICKVTIWRPTDRNTLRVFYWNGMAPDSAHFLEFEINPGDPNNDTFAAMSCP